MKSILIILLISFTTGTCIACTQENELQKSAAQTIYEDSDARDYICGIGANCSFDDFFPKLKIANINLNEPGKTERDGIVIEPVNPGRQFFSAVFLKKDCTYRMIFSPDVTMSGIKPLPLYRNGFPILQSVERESTVRWNEIEFAFDPKNQAYSEFKKHCYAIKSNDDKKRQAKCN